jgi:S-formylglutathione hydrolase
MRSYVVDELPRLVESCFSLRGEARGIFGHSMGGHGALTIGLSCPDRYRSCSAFAPISAPSRVPWGQKAFARYLGEDRNAWAAYDAVELLRDHRFASAPLVDQGEADKFLVEQLRPELLASACQQAGQPLTLRRHPGYDHSYYFVSTFIADHLRHHAQALAG